MIRPVLHIDHPSTLKRAQRDGADLGHLWCGMAGASRHGGLRARDLAPRLEDMRAVRAGQITIQRYARRCLDRWRALDLSPAAQRLQDGDGVFCECARPGSRRRTHPCHRELWPLVLVPAGWDVVLYARRATSRDGVVVWADDGAEVRDVLLGEYGWARGPA